MEHSWKGKTRQRRERSVRKCAEVEGVKWYLISKFF
jgi:hypothetical protein